MEWLEGILGPFFELAGIPKELISLVLLRPVSGSGSLVLAEGVYYQSYAFDMKRGISDPSMSLFYHLIRKLEGPNDGLVSVKSARWGDFQGIRSGMGKYGISHPAAADSGKGAARRGRPDAPDITCLYREIAGRLKSLGY